MRTRELMLAAVVLGFFALFSTMTGSQRAPREQPRHVFGTSPTAHASPFAPVAPPAPATTSESAFTAVQTSLTGFLAGLDEALQTTAQLTTSTPPAQPVHPSLRQATPPAVPPPAAQLAPYQPSQRQFAQHLHQQLRHPPGTAPAAAAGGGPADNAEASWCKQKAATHGVVPGASWGSLPKSEHKMWGDKDCDGHLSGAPKAATRSVSGPSTAPAANSDVGTVTKWCRKAMWQFDVRPGTNWGSMSGRDQKNWETLGCDSLITNQGAFVDSDLMPTCPDNTAGLPIVAVCCGTTTRKVTNPQIHKLALFRYLLPSMAHTLDCGFRYMAVVGYDKGDQYYDTLHGKMQVEQWFETHVQAPLKSKGVEAQLHLVKVDNKLKKPGPVFNVITKHAHTVGAEYIYRVNDDTELRTPWARSFVNQLMKLGFPYGAVGPLCQQGNQKILTHDFTHRTHMEIFGDYYPKELVDWWMDDWISIVYGHRRTRQGRSVPVIHHTGAHGQRYQVDKSNQKHLRRLLDEGKQKIIGYMKQHGADNGQIQSVQTDRFTGHPFIQF